MPIAIVSIGPTRAGKTVKAIYKTVKATYKTVKATYTTVKAIYKTVKAGCKRVKTTYKTVFRVEGVDCLVVVLRAHLEDVGGVLRVEGVGFRV